MWRFYIVLPLLLLCCCKTLPESVDPPLDPKAVVVDSGRSWKHSTPKSTSPTQSRGATEETRTPKPGNHYHWVNGYHRGPKWIEGHWRTNRNETVTDNFDFEGVQNPETGEVGENRLGMIWVAGYTRKDGTKVEGYWRKK